MSIEECALSLMNNGQYFMAKNYPQLLVQARIDQLWQSSAYAGTCGKYTTALMQRWLEDLNNPPTAVGGIGRCTRKEGRKELK